MKKSTNSIKTTPFKPSFCLRNRHIQTLYATFFRKQKEPPYHIESYRLRDGDFLDIYYNPSLMPQDANSLAVLFHGLAGSHKSPYIQAIFQKLSSCNIAPVIMHYRSTSGRDNRYPQSYHSGKTDDILEFLESLHTNYPDKQLFCVGYSMGANMLLKLLGELSQKSFIKAAVAVSAPMDLALCANVMKKGFSRLYQAYLLRDLQKALGKKYKKHDMQKIIGIKQEALKQLNTFWKFDEVYTAKVHGFHSAAHYYETASSKKFLKSIATPTLIIHAKDDPFMTPEVLPKSDELSASIELEILEYGGHVGFISGTLFSPHYWLEERIVEYLLANMSK